MVSLVKRRVFGCLRKSLFKVFFSLLIVLLNSPTIIEILTYFVMALGRSIFALEGSQEIERDEFVKGVDGMVDAFFEVGLGLYMEEG
jgi:hypothetical protein